MGLSVFMAGSPGEARLARVLASSLKTSTVLCREEYSSMHMHVTDVRHA